MILKIIRMILRRTIMSVVWFVIFCMFFSIIWNITLSLSAGFIKVPNTATYLYLFAALGAVALIGSFLGKLPGCRVQESELRNPAIAGILSFFAPGLGQAYNSTRGKGYLFLLSYFPIAILYLVLLYLFNERLPGEYATFSLQSIPNRIMIICATIMWIWNVYDANVTAKRINAGQISIYGGRFSSILKFIVFSFLLNVLSIIIFVYLALNPPTNRYFQKVMTGKMPSMKKSNAMQKPKNPVASIMAAMPAKITTPKEYKVEGISYSENDPVAVIGGSIYRINEDICQGKITDITTDTVTVKFADKQKNYQVGQAIKEQGAQ